MEFVNSKSNVSALAGRFAPPEHLMPLGDLSLESYYRLRPDSGVVYLKTCTGEGGGVGVVRARSVSEFADAIKKLQVQGASSDSIILQPEIRGRNFRFQVLLDPVRPDATIPVVSLTEQIVAEDGIRYTGSKPIPVVEKNLKNIRGAIIQFVSGIRERFPNAVGFAACDFFLAEDGRIVLFDPALRPTGNTAAFMLRLDLAARGVDAVVSDYHRIHLKSPMLPFSEVEKTLGSLADLSRIFKEGRGILPWGYNHYQGEGTFMVIGKSDKEVRAIWDSARTALTRKFSAEE